MIKQHIVLWTILFFSFSLSAQLAEPVYKSERYSDHGRSMCDNDAGELSGPFDIIAQSKLLGPTLAPPTVLCYQDRFTVKNSNAKFDDPDNSTEPGIGYIWYREQPTVSGTSVAEIENDPNIIDAFGSVFDYDFNIYLDQIDGTALFSNTNQNNGKTIPELMSVTSEPVRLWFAPATIDDFYGRKYESGCINVRTDEAFPVVYLNELKAEDCKVDLFDNVYKGSFKLTGGYAEYNGLSYQSVKLLRSSDPVPLNKSTFMHGDIVEFIADEEGTYTLIVEDNIGCSLIKEIEVVHNDKVVGISAVPHTPGPYLKGSEVCFDFNVKNFTDITSFSWVMQFDSKVLEYKSITVNTSVNNFSPFNMSDVKKKQGLLPISYEDASTIGQSLADGESLMQLCFDIIGEPGECVKIDFIALYPTDINCSYADKSGPEDVNRKAKIEFLNEVICVTTNTLDIVHSTCGAQNSNQGTIIFAPVGGTAPYSYTSTCSNSGIIANENQEIRISNLTAGPCTVTVTDAAGNTATKTITVGNETSLSYDLELNNPACDYVNSGEIKIKNVTGGAGDYSVSWSNGINNVDSIRFLYNGYYSVTVEDVNGCRLEKQILLNTEAVKIALSVDQQPTCEGIFDGKITANATGGTPSTQGYTFEWEKPYQEDENVTSSSFFKAGTDSIRLVVTDANHCTSSIYIELEPLKKVEASFNIQDNTCEEAEAVAEVTASTTNNTGAPFTFKWQDENFQNVPNITGSNTSKAENLKGGTYTISIKDTDGCTLDTMLSISEISPMSALVTIEFPCTATKGDIIVFLSGGSNPKISSWKDEPLNDSPVRTGLPAGEYIFFAEDDNGCMYSDTIVLSKDAEITPDGFVNKDVSCAGFVDGEITVSVPGSGSYIYEWQGPDGMLTDQTPKITGLKAGKYIVKVKKGDCFAIDSTILMEPDAIFANPLIDIPTCYGEASGRIELKTTGGSGPYTVSWKDFPNSSSVVQENLKAGSYDLTITDNNGCPKDTTIVIDEQKQFDITTNIIDGIDCYGENSATVEVVFSGGPVGDDLYKVKWSNGEGVTNLSTITKDTAFQIPAGDSYVVVYDAVCTDTVKFNISSPDILNLDKTQTKLTDASCFGVCDGTASLVASSAGNTSYRWLADNQVLDSRSDLCHGWQKVEITDVNNCKAIDSIFIGQPDSLVLVLDPNKTSNPSCNDNSNGTIAVSYNGGNVGQVDYKWTNDVSTSELASNLSVGLYTVTITDSKGCMDTLSHTLVTAPPIKADVPQPTEPLCYGGRTCIQVDNITGGSGNVYRFSINDSNLYPSDSCVSVFAGDYEIKVFDLAGCFYTTNISIGQPEQFIVDLGGDLTVDLGDSSKVVLAQFGEFNRLDSIYWTSTVEKSFECVDDMDCKSIRVFPSTDTKYKVTAIDSNGCMAMDEIWVRIDDERKIFIPNTFTPNGDSKNDFFRIYTGIGVKEITVFQVYDRWGNKMYEERNLVPKASGVGGWDGTFRGSPVNAGLYTYRALIQFIDGKALSYKGDILLQR